MYIYIYIYVVLRLLLELHDPDEALVHVPAADGEDLLLLFVYCSLCAFFGVSFQSPKVVLECRSSRLRSSLRENKSRTEQIKHRSAPKVEVPLVFVPAGTPGGHPFN